MSTRAAYSNSQHRSSATRAATTSGQSSGSSTESGRERRRRGKLKMQQQLATALSRISDLEQQNQCLRRLVEELLPTGPASPELFDVYDIAEETASVATQTEISVNFQSPDIFVRAEDLPACAAEQCAAESHIQSLAIAHADAAAGLDVAHAPLNGANKFDATTTRLRNFTSVSQDGQADASSDSSSQSLAYSLGPCALESSRQAPEGVLSRHREESQVLSTPGESQCGAEPQQAVRLSDNSHHDVIAHATNIFDFNSQSLANRFGKCASGILEQQLGLVSSAADASAAEHAHTLKEFNSQSLARFTEHTVQEIPRRAPEVVHSRHRGKTQSPSTSRVPQGESEPQQAVWLSENSHHDVKVHAAPQSDFNFQSLASISGPSVIGTLEKQTRALEPTVAGASDVQRTRGFTSQNLAHLNRPRAQHGYHLRQAPDDDHSRHRGEPSGFLTSSVPRGTSHHDVTAEAVNLQNFNSQSLANISGPSANGILGQPPPDSGSSVVGAIDVSSQASPNQLACGPLPLQTKDFNSGPLEVVTSCNEQADASLDLFSQNLAYSPEPTGHECPRQAPEVVISRHREKTQAKCEAEPQQAVSVSGNSHHDVAANAANIFDFNSQSLARPIGSSAFGILEQHLDSVASPADAGAAEQAHTSRDFNSRRHASSSGHTVQEIPRQAPEVVHTRHHGITQSPRTSSEPQGEFEPQPTGWPSENSRLDVTAHATSTFDFNSQSLVSGPSAFGNLEKQTNALGPSAAHASDAQLTKDFRTQHRAHLYEPAALEALPTADSDTLQQAPDDVNARHCRDALGDSAGHALQDQRSTLFLGPSERECQRTTGADSVREEHRNQLSAFAASADPCSKDFKSQEFSASQASAATQCGPLPADFLQTFEGILDIYVKRRKPSRNTTRATARGINFIALKAGVAFNSYSDTLRAKSPLLWQEVHMLSEKLNQS